MNKKLIILLILSLCYGWGGYAQTEHVPYDSTSLEMRSFDSAQLAEYQAEFQYKEPIIDTKPSRLERLLNKWFNIRNEASLRVMKYLYYILIALAVLAILYIAFRMNIGGIFSPPAKKIDMGFEEVEEDIHEMDFDNLLKEAVQEGNYRKAVRLLYLESLKLLTDKEYIIWKPQKTNYDYLGELKQPELRVSFGDLTRRFEYVWYGHFDIDHKGFDQMQQSFRQFQSQIPRS